MKFSKDAVFDDINSLTGRKIVQIFFKNPVILRKGTEKKKAALRITSTSK